MKKLITLVILVLPILVWGQKIKVKKELISVDGKAYAKIKKTKKGLITFQVSNLSDQVLYSFDLQSISPYEKGPILRFYKISTPTAPDTVIIDYGEYHNAKRLAKLLVSSKLIDAQQVNQDAFKQLKQQHPQDMVETFLASHELTLSKLVPRFPNSKTSIDDMFAEKMQPDKKYYIVSGNQHPRQTIGYYKIENFHEGEIPLLLLNFYLPNDLHLAQISFQEVNRKKYSTLRTFRDKTNHNKFTTNLTLEGIVKTMNYLVTNKYM